MVPMKFYKDSMPHYFLTMVPTHAKFVALGSALCIVASIGNLKQVAAAATPHLYCNLPRFLPNRYLSVAGTS